MHWERKQEQKPENLKPWGYWYRAPSAEVEMTAYVLMSIMHGNQKSADYSASIIQWLNKQRNPYGGFSSTQVRGSLEVFLHVIYTLNMYQNNPLIWCRLIQWTDINTKRQINTLYQNNPLIWCRLIQWTNINTMRQINTLYQNNPLIWCRLIQWTDINTMRH